MIFQIEHRNTKYKISANYRDRSKSLILLLHGLGCSKESFQDIFAINDFDNYSLLVPDLLGHGGSSKPSDNSYSMEEQAALLKILLNKIQYNEIHLVTHSMGNAIGLLLAKDLTNLKSYVNIEGNLIADDCGVLSRTTITVSYDEFENKVFDELRSRMESLNQPGTKLWVVQSEKVYPLAFYKFAQSLVKWSDSGKLLKLFQDLECRKIYFYGSDNSNMLVLDKLHDITKIKIPQSGHFVMNDHPQVFYKQLAKFFEIRS